MLAIVIIALVISLLVVVIVIVSAILRIAFGNPNELHKQNEKKEIDSALATLYDVKIDAKDPLSHTYGELFEQELVGKSKS
jgi:hypothetical protein